MSGQAAAPSGPPLGASADPGRQGSAAVAQLARMQEAFMRYLLDEEAPLPPGLGEGALAGLEIYRGNYRGALMEAMRASYERTARWVGDEAFERAAAHHLITHPPSSWTIDDAGNGFADTCAELFARDREVAELAWLEWAMGQCFTAPDVEPLGIEGFARASAGFGEEDWEAMRLVFQPRAAVRRVHHDLTRIWRLAGAGQEEAEPGEENAPRDEDGGASPRAADNFLLPSRTGAACLVWREGERPVFALVSVLEGQAFERMANGASYGEACSLCLAELGEDQAAAAAGAMLARWLKEGIVIGLA